MLVMKIKVMTVMIIKISELQLLVKLHNPNTLIPYLKNKAIAQIAQIYFVGNALPHCRMSNFFSLEFFHFR